MRVSTRSSRGHLRIEGEPDLSEWEGLVDRIHAATEPVTIAVVGKYVTLRDAYLSVMEALYHGGFHHGADVQIRWVASDDLGGQATEEALTDVHGVLIPGGFGIRGVEGKVAAVRYARERDVPFLGICLGLQCAVIEFARNVMGLDGANSSEFDPATPHAVIDLLPEQKDVTDLGGSMRLGAQPCHLVPGTRAAEAYGESVVYERHRHRWEVNPAYHDAARGARARALGQLPQRAPHRDHRASRPSVLRRRRSSTPSCGRARRVRTRCSATSSAPPSVHRRGAGAPVVVGHRLGRAVPEPLSVANRVPRDRSCASTSRNGPGSARGRWCGATTPPRCCR